MAVKCVFVGWGAGFGRVVFPDGREGTFRARAIRTSGRALTVGDDVLVAFETTEVPGEETISMIWFEGNDPGTPPPPLPKPQARTLAVTADGVFADLRAAGLGGSLDSGGFAALATRDTGLSEALYRSPELAAQAALRAVYGDEGPTEEGFRDGIFLVSAAASRQPDVIEKARAALETWIGSALPRTRSGPKSVGELASLAAETLLLVGHGTKDAEPAHRQLWLCNPGEVWKVCSAFEGYLLREEAPPCRVTFRLVEASGSTRNAAVGNFSSGEPSIVFKAHATSCATCETHFLNAIEESVRRDLADGAAGGDVIAREYQELALEILRARSASGQLQDGARYVAIEGTIRGITREPVLVSADERQQVKHAERRATNYDVSRSKSDLFARGDLSARQVWLKLADVWNERDEVRRAIRMHSWEGGKVRTHLDTAEEGLARWSDVRALVVNHPSTEAWDLASTLATGELNAIACTAFCLDDVERAEQFLRAAALETPKPTYLPWVEWLLTGDMKILSGPQARKLTTAALNAAFKEVVWARDDHEMGRNTDARFLREHRLDANLLEAALQERWEDVPAPHPNDVGALKNPIRHAHEHLSFLQQLQSHAQQRMPERAVLDASLRCLFSFEGDETADTAALLPLLALYGRQLEPGVPGVRLLHGLRQFGPARYERDGVGDILTRLESLLRAARAAGRGVHITLTEEDSLYRMTMAEPA